MARPKFDNNTPVNVITDYGFIPWDSVNSRAVDYYGEGHRILSRALSENGMVTPDAADVLEANAYPDSGINSVTSGNDVVLTNPAKRVQVITITTTGKYVWLPPANEKSSPIEGKGFIIINAGNSAFGLKDSAGNIIILTSDVQSISRDEVYEALLYDKSTSHGSWLTNISWRGVTYKGVRGKHGGHSDTTKAFGALLSWDNTNEKFVAIEPPASGLSYKEFLAGPPTDFTSSPAYRRLIGREEIPVIATAFTPRVTDGPTHGLVEMATNKNIVETLDFSPTTPQYAQLEIPMPKAWDPSVGLKLTPVWSHPSTTTNFGVVWSFDAVAISDDDTLDVAFGTPQTSTDTGGTTNDLYRGPQSAAITPAGSPATADILQIRISRATADANDTMAVNARLHSVILSWDNSAGTDD